MDLETRYSDFEEIPDDLGAYAVMGQDGDTKHVWSPKKADEVEAARILFETLTKKGYRAFKLTRLGMKGKPVPYFHDALGRVLFQSPPVAPKEDGEVMDEFDAGASRVLFTAPMQGG